MIYSIVRVMAKILKPFSLFRLEIRNDEQNSQNQINRSRCDHQLMNATLSVERIHRDRIRKFFEQCREQHQRAITRRIVCDKQKDDLKRERHADKAVIILVLLVF